MAYKKTNLHISILLFEIKKIISNSVLFDIIYINRLVFFEIYNNIIFYYIYISVFLILHKKPLTYCYFVIELKTIETVSKSTPFGIVLFFYYISSCIYTTKYQKFIYRNKKSHQCIL